MARDKKYIALWNVMKREGRRLVSRPLYLFCMLLKLRPLVFECVGVDSPDDLLKSKLGEYGEMQHGWTAEEAKGFIKVLSTPLRVYYGIHEDEER